MRIVSSTVGSRTITVWNRRSSAESFSMNLRYSASVVAPMHCISPRESAGLMMFEASNAPSAAPAPTSVCNSSTKRITFFTRRISSITALIRSSNCPRYLVPATMSARSSVMTRLSRRSSGTSPETIAWARPSTIAVLPTPASPSRTGLFFVRRQSTWITRSISEARPITGSSASFAASSFRSRPKAVSAGVLAFLGSPSAAGAEAPAPGSASPASAGGDPGS